MVLKSCVAELRSSVSELECKLDSVMNPLSMTESLSGMDPQQILGGTIPGVSYAQITKNSTSLWKLETRHVIWQQTAKPSMSQGCKSNLLIYVVDSGTKRILQSLNVVC